MKSINQKLEILESLDALDQVQAEQVLAYIKNLIDHPSQSEHQQKVKREAMRQIRRALRNR